MQLVDNQRHLLAGGDQQRAQADGVRVDLHRLGDDRLGGHLLAQVDYLVAVVGEDGLHQVLADVVHVAIHGGEHQCALGDPGFLLQVVLQVRHGFLHHLGGLEHKRQDQLARAELIAYLFHGGQQHVVEHGDGCFVLAAIAIFTVDDLVDVSLHVLFVAVDDAVVQALFRAHGC